MSDIINEGRWARARPSTRDTMDQSSSRERSMTLARFVARSLRRRSALNSSYFVRL